jgi:sugar lactone lactonase YvrE
MPAIIPADQPMPAPSASPTTPGQAVPTPPATRTVDILATVAGQPMAEAAVKVLLAKDLTTVVEGGKLDAAGHLFLPLTETLTPGTVVLVQVQKDGAVLSGLFQVPAPAFTAKQAAAEAQWALNLATTIVTRKMASKVAEVIRSAPPDVAAATLQGIQAQLQQWVQQAQTAIQGTLLDVRADQARAIADQNPTAENVETLANHLIRYSPLRSVFVSAVDTCNRQVVANMSNGGPLVVPAVWQVAEVQPETPQVTLVDADQLQITFGDTKALVTIANAAERLAFARTGSTATTSNDRFAQVNTTYVPAPAVGGGGGGTPVASATIASLSPLLGSVAGFGVVTITGTKLTGATAVTFGGVAARRFTVDSDTQITTVTPAHAAGAANVAVTTTEGTLTKTGGYTFSKVMGTVAGNGTLGSTGDGGSAPLATVNDIAGGAVDAAGNLYLADYDGNRIRKIDRTTGVISTYCGDGTAGSTGDGGPASAARLNNPNGVVFDTAGNLYVTEHSGHRIRMIDTAGNISTVCGTGAAGSTGDGAAATSATINQPNGIAIDGAGDLYITEWTGHRVRKFTVGGNISTVCGTGTPSSTGDGAAATAATVSTPAAVAVDGANVFVLENSGRRVRMFPVGGGNISTVCGTGVSSSTGDGAAATAATIRDPYGITIDSAHTIYVAERAGNRIRKFTVGGNISTFCGNGTATSTGDGSAPADATINGPSGTVIDASGRIFVLEGYGRRISVY